MLKKKYSDELKKAAEAISGDVKLTVYTDQPGIHFYSGNYLDGQVHGKSNTVYHKRSGFALETQNWPDAINHKDFPSAVLKKGVVYHSKTIFELKYGI
ncbi:Aldose 1-epimerase [bioreactor metagenome]|uniref:Aldose 1-epimerase n=1 Tax=bioreactor metagenome TaxID=1076179 RepID=A0A645AAX6_9ZZZZ